MPGHPLTNTNAILLSPAPGVRLAEVGYEEFTELVLLSQIVSVESKDKS